MPLPGDAPPGWGARQVARVARMLTLATAFHARAWLDAAVRAELVRETFDT